MSGRGSQRGERFGASRSAAAATPGAGAQPDRGAASPAPICPACVSPTPADARFCPQCGTPLGRGAIAVPPAAPDVSSRAATQRRQLTVMFCDLVGSSALSTQLDPEDFTDIIAAFHRCVTEVASRHGGFLARYMGDGALIYFGYPQANEDDAERAVRAGLAIVAAVSALRVGGGRALHVRIGIATGLVVVGDVAGTGGPHHLDVAGETPNLAARLQGLAEPDTVLVSGNVHALAGRLFEWRELGKRPIKGWENGVPVWQALRPAQGPAAARRRAADAPLLGRAADVAQISALWQTAMGGQGHTVLLMGEAGIGKSRLASQLLDPSVAGQVTRVQWFCARRHSSVALQPVIEQIAHLADIRPDQPPAERLAKLEAALLAPDPVDLALLADLAGIPIDGLLPVPLLAPLRRRARLMEAMFGVLTRAASIRPVLAVCEDAHWADPTTLDLLGHAARRAAEHPMLLVVTGRPEFSPAWRDADGVRTITLSALRPDEGTALARWTAGAHGLSDAMVRDILARADGMPLYIEELAKAVVATGGAGVTPPAGEPSPAPVLPISLHASLIARLDRLGAAREVAEVAAVIGRDFDLGLLARIVEHDADVLRGALALLIEHGIVVARGDEHAHFRHALLHDAAYGMITRDRRRALHRRIAEAIERDMPALAQAQPHLLAQHWTEAREGARAAAGWLRAARQALRGSAPREALAAAESGFALLEHLPSDAERMRAELELRVVQASSLFVARGPATRETGAALTRARDLSLALPGTPYLLFTQATLWTNNHTRGDVRVARALAREILEQPATEPAAGPPAEAAQETRVRRLTGLRACGVNGFVLGEFEESVGFLTEGIGLYDPTMQPVFAGLTLHDPVISMRCYRSWDLLFLGRLTEARAEARIAFADAQAFGHFFTIAHARLNQLYIDYHIGDHARVMPALDALLALTEEHGIPYFEAVARIFKGYYGARIEGAAYDPEEGLRLLRAGIEWHVASDAGLHVPGFRAMEAELLARAGDLPGARVRIAQALAGMAQTGAVWEEAEIRTVHGDVLRRGGDAATAEAEYREAIRVAESQRARLRTLRTSRALADLLAQADRHSEAASVLDAALAPFATETEAPAVLHARAFLASIPGHCRNAMA